MCTRTFLFFIFFLHFTLYLLLKDNLVFFLLDIIEIFLEFEQFFCVGELR
jgi:hypothetical protein